ncbi:MAG: hypothetical protein Kow0029_23000 [Candidatus Rifleibacteriota bacterium]
MKRKILAIATVSAICLAGVWLFRFAWLPWVAIDPEPFIKERFSSGGAYLDRENVPLRLFPDANGDFFCYCPIASHSETIVQALLTAEDRSFYTHPGFDIFAIGRAAWQNLTNLRVISGASTISQQLIRILKPRPRTFTTKISEVFAALLLEKKYDKNKILEFYLNSVPMFGNIRGFYLASLLLFKKTPDALNLAESACLAALVQSPGKLSPFSQNGNKLLRKRRDWVIREMLKIGYCDRKTAEMAIKSNIPEFRSRLPFNAPHFCDYLVSKYGPPQGNQQTTISLPLQNTLYKTLQSHLPRLAKSGARQTCAMILSAKNMEILAMIGSAEFGPISGGFNNGCLAKRSGGSILKPFLYGLALENGYYPSYVISDTMQPYKTPQGEYLPYNADRRSYGPVTLRNALGNSLNISAVKMLNLVGIKNFFNLLVDLELLEYQPGAANFYGLGLAIGNPELRMLDVAKAYGIFVNAGKLKSLSVFTNQKFEEKQIFSPQTAYLIFDILSDPAARLLTFGNPSFFKFKSKWSFKTGTSTNYRDCWIVGFNANYIVAIWAGNFDGSPTRGLAGSTACGPILKNLCDILETYENSGQIEKPAGINRVKVCSISGARPGKNCPNTGYDLFNGNEDQIPICEFHKTDANAHALPSEYARWLQKRAQRNNLDPFKLQGNMHNFDPYEIIGISKEATISSISTGPIVITDQKTSGVWNNIKIVSPHDGDRYIMSIGRENFLYLRAIPELATNEIVWLINGLEFIRTPPPFEAYWPMKPGKFRITAISDGQAAAEVSVLIEN